MCVCVSVNTQFLYQLGGQVLPLRSSQSLGQQKTQCNTHVHSLRADWNTVGTMRQADMTGFSTGGQSHSTGRITQSHLTLWPHGLCSPWNSPGQNTGVGNHSLLWGIFPTQGLNPGPLHCRQILYQLNPKGSLRCLADAWISHFSLGVEERPHFWSDSSFSPSFHPQMLVHPLRFKAQPWPLGMQCWMRQSWSLPSRLPSRGREVKNSHRKCGIQYIITNCEKGNERKD